MPSPLDPRPPKDDLAREIDRLLKQLPGADPHLRGEAEPPPAPNPPRPVAAAGASVAAKGPPPSLLAQRLSVWLRAVLAGALALGITQWPYAHDCGRPLYLYLGAVAGVMVGGAWASVWAWRLRSAAAHVLALVIVFWGIVLAAEQVLPRIGYAAAPAEWRCPAP